MVSVSLVTDERRPTVRNVIAIAVVLCVLTDPLFAAGGPFVPDENTVGLFHLDGSEKDASAALGRVGVRGEVSYTPGKFGLANEKPVPDSFCTVLVHFNPL